MFYDSPCALRLQKYLAKTAAVTGGTNPQEFGAGPDNACGPTSSDPDSSDSDSDSDSDSGSDSSDSESDSDSDSDSEKEGNESERKNAGGSAAKARSKSVAAPTSTNKSTRGAKSSQARPLQAQGNSDLMAAVQASNEGQQKTAILLLDKIKDMQAEQAAANRLGKQAELDQLMAVASNAALDPQLREAASKKIAEVLGLAL